MGERVRKRILGNMSDLSDLSDLESVGYGLWAVGWGYGGLGDQVWVIWGAESGRGPLSHGR